MQSLGEMVLAVGLLERALFDFLTKKGIKVEEKMSLGKLIEKIKNDKNDTVSEHLGFLLKQRNYFVHNIAWLMSGHEIDDNKMKIFKNRAQSIRDEAEFFAALFTNFQFGTVAKSDV